MAVEKIAKEKKDWKKTEGKYRDKLEVKQDFKFEKLSTFKMLWLSIWRITFLLDNCSCFYSKLSRGLLLKGLEKMCFDWGNLRPVLMSSTFERKKKDWSLLSFSVLARFSNTVMFILIKTTKLLLFLAIYLDYVGLMKKKKCGVWSPCTFCIKVCGFEMFKNRQKIDFSI